MFYKSATHLRNEKNMWPTPIPIWEKLCEKSQILHLQSTGYFRSVQADIWTWTSSQNWQSECSFHVVFQETGICFTSARSSRGRLMCSLLWEFKEAAVIHSLSNSVHMFSILTTLLNAGLNLPLTMWAQLNHLQGDHWSSKWSYSSVFKKTKMPLKKWFVCSGCLLLPAEMQVVRIVVLQQSVKLQKYVTETNVLPLKFLDCDLVHVLFTVEPNTLFLLWWWWCWWWWKQALLFSFTHPGCTGFGSVLSKHPPPQITSISPLFARLLWQPIFPYALLWVNAVGPWLGIVRQAWCDSKFDSSPIVVSG